MKKSLYLTITLLLLLSLFANAASDPIKQMEESYRKGNYKKVLSIAIKAQRKNGTGYLKNIDFLHFKLSSQIHIHATLTGALISDYIALRKLDKRGKYYKNNIYADFKTELEGFCQKAIKNGNQELANSICKPLAAVGDTLDIYTCLYPKPKAKTYEEVYAYIKSYNYRSIDSIARRVGKKESIQAQALALTKGYKYDFQKVRAISAWITFNIKYDDSYTNYYAAETFRDLTGVCNGYALLFEQMCDYVKISGEKVSGKANNGDGTGYGGHAWNLLYMQGFHFYVDLTWATNKSNPEKMDEIYFCAPTNNLWKSHKF